MLKFAYHTPSGELHIVHAVPKDHLERVLGPLTDEEYKAHVIERAIPKDAVDVKEITAEKVPVDREYRNAWKLENNEITHCMSKSRVIHLDRLRQKRKEKLAQLDLEWMREFSKGNLDAAKAVEEKRQRLRDMPKDVKNQLDGASCIEELKEVSHEDLDN